MVIYMIYWKKTIKIYENWDNFIAENHLENEIGLENEMLDMVKRDVSWACVERVLNI